MRPGRPLRRETRSLETEGEREVYKLETEGERTEMLVAGWCHVAADTRGVTIYSSSSLTSEWSPWSHAKRASVGRLLKPAWCP